MSHSTNCSLSFHGKYRNLATQVSRSTSPHEACSGRLITSKDLIGNDTLFEVGLDPYVEGQGHPLPNDAFVRWAMAPKAMYLNFSDPTVLNLRNTKWNPDYAVIPKDYPEDSWIYMVIYTNRTSIPSSGRRTVPAAHPVIAYLPRIAATAVQAANTFSDPFTRARFCSPTAISTGFRRIPPHAQIRQPATPGRRPAPGQWIYRHRIQSGQSRFLAAPLPHCLACVFRTGDADPRATRGRSADTDASTVGSCKGRMSEVERMVQQPGQSLG